VGLVIKRRGKVDEVTKKFKIDLENFQLNYSDKINNSIRTDRLKLRYYNDDDKCEFSNLASNYDIWKYIGWPEPKVDTVNRAFSDRLKKQNIRFAIADLHTNRLVGDFTICPDDFLNDRLEFKDKLGISFSFCLKNSYQGKGLMKSLLEKVIEYIFQEIRADYIVYAYFNYNVNSEKLCKKLGFKYYTNKELTIWKKKIDTKVCIMQNNYKKR